MQGIKELTHGPIKRQLFNLALPIMGTSFIQMAYSLTDMAWVGRLGSEAVAAVGAVGILAWMTVSISYLNKVGAEVSVAQSIGAASSEDARMYAGHNITLALIISIFWGLLLFSFADIVIGFFNLEESISQRGAAYLRIISTAFPFVMTTSAFTGIYNAAGLSKYPFFISGSGLVLNMILDPLLIFGFDMGTNGAALATWMSEAFVCFLFIYFLKRRKVLFGGFDFLVKLRKRFTLRIVQIGLPPAVLNVLFAIINLLMGRTAATYGGHIGLMTLTAGGQIEALAWNTSQGFSTALSAFVGQNFTARKHERIVKAFKATLFMTALIGVGCTILFVFFGSEAFSVIVPEKTAYEAGGVFLRIDGYSMILMMFEITTQGLFYGTGRTLPPAIVSIGFNSLRIPLAMLLVTTALGITGVWWAISLTSMMKGIALFSWYLVIRKRLIFN